MRVFKPLQLSLLHKSFSYLNKNQLAVSLLLGFPFDRSQEVLLEQDLWKFLADQLGQDEVIDFCMPKPQAEVLVYGNYYSPGGKPVSADRVQFTIGPVNKSLAVIGDRYWRTLLTPTEPEPFTQLPISYQYAFGGKGYKKNPSGKGMDEVDVFGEQRLPMPNIEYPDHLVTSKDHRPEPAGMGPLDMMWEPRSSKMGTYDETWQRKYFPGLAPDLDWNHFNTAPPDQWIEGFWNGGETFQLINMHADKEQVGGKLPAFRTRCFIEKQLQDGSLFSEVEMRAETVCLFPNVETGVVIYRGVIETREDDAADVEHLLVAYEDINQPKRPEEYYEEALRNRLDDSKALKYMMSTKDIIPESERCGFTRLLDGIEEDGQSAMAQNMDAKVEAVKQQAQELLEQKKQQLKEKLQAEGIDPEPHLEKLELKVEPVDDPHIKGIMGAMEKILPGSTQGDVKNIKVEEIDFSLLDELNDKMDAMAEARKEDAKNKLKDVIKKVVGTEAEKQVRQQVETVLQKMDEPTPLPRPVADETLEKLKYSLENIEEKKQQLRKQGVAEEQLPVVDISLDEVEIKIWNGFEQVKEMYRSGAHFIEGKPPHSEPMDIVQYRLQKLLDKGESLAGRDLSGVDLSGLDLTGKDLSDCYLEYADLSNTNLQGANLKRAIITHANLRNANLTAADCREANLGDSNLKGANLIRARLENAELSKANMKDARIIDCDLTDVNFLEANMETVNFSGSIFKGTNFLNLDFTGGKFISTQMIECNFLESTLKNTDFSAAHLCGSNFVGCNLDHSKFIEANMKNVRFPAGCSLTNCNFNHANLDKVNMRDCQAEGSSFEYATFHQADFSGANMQNTKFYAAQGKRALLMKTDLGGADFSSVNLMEGSLLKARLTNADLSYSNLYAVELMNATVGGTNFNGTNLDLTKLEDWRPDRDS